MAVATFTPAEILQKIRYDPSTKKGSVYDVIRLVTGCETKHAGQTLSSITDKFPEVTKNFGDFQFPGRGQRPTPVAFLKDLIEIAWLCPGKHAKEFRRTGAVTLCRALGGDLSLVDEIRARHGEVSETEQEALLAGTGVTAAEANGQALVPMHPEEERALKLRNDEQALDVFEKAGAAMKRLREWAAEEEDVRHRLFLEDTAKNMFVRYATLVTGVESSLTGAEVRLPLTISGVAADLGTCWWSRPQSACWQSSGASCYRSVGSCAVPRKKIRRGRQSRGSESRP